MGNGPSSMSTVLQVFLERAPKHGGRLDDVRSRARGGQLA